MLEYTFGKIRSLIALRYIGSESIEEDDMSGQLISCEVKRLVVNVVQEPFGRDL